MSIPKIIPERNSREKFLSEIELTEKYPDLYNIGGEFSVFINHPDSKRNVYVPILINLERMTTDLLPIIVLTIDRIKLTRKALRELNSSSVISSHRIAAEIVSQLDHLRLVKRSLSLENDSPHIIQEEKTVEIKDLGYFTLYPDNSMGFSNIVFKFNINIILKFNAKDSLCMKDFMTCSGKRIVRSNIEMYIKGNIS